MVYSVLNIGYAGPRNNIHELWLVNNTPHLTKCLKYFTGQQYSSLKHSVLGYSFGNDSGAEEPTYTSRKRKEVEATKLPTNTFQLINIVGGLLLKLCFL